jgi:hypothetical protein
VLCASWSSQTTSAKHRASRVTYAQMCMQCMATAMTAGATASGTRAFIAAKHFSWVTPKRLRAITITLIVLALAASSLFVGGTDQKQPVKRNQAARSAALR